MFGVSRLGLTVLGTFLLVSAFGCTAEHVYTLNPDGSGRVEIRWVSAEGGYRNARRAETLLNRSTDVQAWRDVSFHVVESGRAEFRATAYFPDVNADPLAGMNRLSIRIVDNDDGTKTLSVRHPRLHDYRPKRALSEAEIRKRMAKVRDDYLKMLRQPGNERDRRARLRIVIDPPGKVRQAVNFRLRDDGKLELLLDGAAIQDALGEILNDKRKVREFVTAGEGLVKCGPTLTAMINERVFGFRAQVEAILEGPFKPKFDYAAALERDKKGLSAVIRDAGFVPAHLPSADEQPRLRDVRVKSAKLSGQTISGILEARLPQRGRYDDGIEIYRVVDDQGRVLVPCKRAWRYRTAQLRADGTRVEFQFSAPGARPGTAKLKEISGVYRYRALGPLFEERVGRLIPRTGARLAKHGFTIDKLARDSRSLMIEWSADAPPRLARVVLMNGRKPFLSYEIEPETFRRKIQRPFRIFDPKRAIPKHLDVVFFTTSKIEHVEAPFVLRDVPVVTGK